MTLPLHVLPGHMFHIQHVDKNRVPRDYAEMAQSGQLLVTKIFYTIQGEGPYAGEPAVFVRLAGCNRGDKTTMGCEFCDTYFLFDTGMAMHFNYIIGEVYRYWPKNSRHRPLVVLTGGEPMIQDLTTTLVCEMLQEGFTVQIESNGDRLSRGFAERCSAADLVVSPKVVRPGMYHKLSPEVWKRADRLKILVDHRPESPYHVLPDYVHEFAKYHPRPAVYLSPLTVYTRDVAVGEVASMWDASMIDPAMTGRNHHYAAKLALEHGFSVSMQKHLFLTVE